MPFPFGNRKSAADETPATEAAPDHELEGYLAALAPESGSRGSGGQVLQLRLDLAANDAMRRLASERNSSPQALAKEWVLERLAWETRG